MYSIAIPGDPLGKQRAAPGSHRNMYTPTKTRDYMRRVGFIWVAKYGGLILNGPLAIDIKFYIRRPKVHYGTGKNLLKLKKSAPFWCLRKPDNDNIEKIIYDGLNAIAFVDDSQIVLNRTQKFWSNNHNPRVDVIIYKLTTN